MATSANVACNGQGRNTEQKRHQMKLQEAFATLLRMVTSLRGLLAGVSLTGEMVTRSY